MAENFNRIVWDKASAVQKIDRRQRSGRVLMRAVECAEVAVERRCHEVS